MSQITSTRRRPRLSRPAAIGLGFVALLVVAVVGWQMRPKAPKEPYRLATVERGDVTRAVSASGALQALVTVDVGSQISGQIRTVAVDFNDHVRRGEVMATLDPQTFETRVAQEKADIAALEAATRQAEATLANAKLDYDRKKVLVEKGWNSPSTLDQATAAYRTAEAALAAARARVNQSRAMLRANEVDLGRTTIVAPIDGVIVDRKIQPGQTVAASLQAPVLFTIAEDLSKLQVKISVDEADVGQVREGQAVRFTVDAFPDDNFQGVVTQVRKQPTTEQNVVAYTVIAVAENPDGKLLPGMTANADIVISTRHDILKAPVAALRWNPNGTVSPVRGGMSFGGPGLGGGPGFGGPGGAGRGPGSGGPAGPTRRGAPARRGTLYVLRDGKPVAIRVQVGASDGTSTEVSGPIKAGDQVIVGGGPRPKARVATPFGPGGGQGGQGGQGGGQRRAG